MTEELQTAKTVGIALLGFGTVGSGVYELIRRRRDSFEQRIGCRLEVKKILVRDRQKRREGVDPALLTDSFDEILADEEIQIVVEVMGGIHPAREYLLRAMAAGRQIVTANKDLLAACGEELFAKADARRVDLRFEASVAGGIPVLEALTGGLAGNGIEEVIGIVNGTTNFILTRMTQEGTEFSDALEEARRLGYAEADPAADVEGLDAARKCAILASLAFHSWVTADQVTAEGITRITAADIRYASQMGYVIKLLAIAREVDGELVASVYPALVPNEHPLASVNDSFNAVFIRGDAVGDTMFYGRGAGKLPTASAVLGDIMTAAADFIGNRCGRIGNLVYRKLPVRPQSESRSRFFLRLMVEDRPGVLASIAGVFGGYGVSMKQLLQQSVAENEAELMIITEKTREKDFHEALLKLTEMEIIRGVSNVIRVHGLK